MSNKKYVSGFMGLAVLATLAVAGPALAQTTPSTTNGGPGAWGGHMIGKGGPRSGMMKPGVFGTVSAISGNIITVTGKQGFGATATTTVTYTVDATNAKVMKSNATSSVSTIAIGDTIMAQGTLTGTNLVATSIRDGVMMRGTKNPNSANTPVNQTSPITGNGQPIIAGAVVSISGSTLTITNKSNVTYTIDTTNAKIVQGQNTIAIGAIAQGDNIIAQGTISGNSMTASSVIDQKPTSASATNGTATTTQPNRGFFGSIGHFFSSLFGF